MGRWMLIRLLTCMRGCVEDFFVSVLFPLALCPAFFFFSLVFPSFQSMLHSSDFPPPPLPLAITIRMLAT